MGIGVTGGLQIIWLYESGKKGVIIDSEIDAIQPQQGGLLLYALLGKSMQTIVNGENDSTNDNEGA